MPKLLFELGKSGRKGYTLPPVQVESKPVEFLLPAELLRKKKARLPEVSENEVIRHFIGLSVLNHHVDKGFYPLGSCTMKYNPKVNETLSRLPELKNLHPLQPEAMSQTALQLMYELGQYLAEISGMADVSLQPAAGAHGEFTGLKVIRAYHERSGNARKYVLIPDSAHGTNPASVTLTGYQSVQISSNEKGLVNLDDLKAKLSDETAALMITNPNTLGLFEEQLPEIAKLVHDQGALMYMDGANLNALLGIVRPGDIGFDVLHINLHKTFSTPHGGGGPGAGPIAVGKNLVDFLPVPRVIKDKECYQLCYDYPDSIGKISTFYGNFAVMVRAYVYIRMLGADGLQRISENAIINANYLMKKLEAYYHLPYSGPAMHEFVLSGKWQKNRGVKTLDIAKRLLDYGFHAPTVYFPLIVKEAIMIEPTETESRETLDRFADAMIEIANDVESKPEIVLNAPTTTIVSRLDEVKAVKEPNLAYSFDRS